MASLALSLPTTVFYPGNVVNGMVIVGSQGGVGNISSFGVEVSCEMFQRWQTTTRHSSGSGKKRRTTRGRTTTGA